MTGRNFVKQYMEAFNRPVTEPDRKRELKRTDRTRKHKRRYECD